MDSLDFSQQIIAIVSFLINVIMIILIVSKSPKSLGAYKHLMILMSISELAYSIIDFHIKPHIISSGNFWIVGTNSEKSRIPLDIAYPLILFWGAAYGIAVACFGIHFIFRYFMVIGIRKLVSGYLMVSIWFSIPVIYGLVYAFMVHLFLNFDENLERLVRSNIDFLKHLPITEMQYYGFSLYKESANSEIPEINSRNLYAVLISTVMVIFVFWKPKRAVEPDTTKLSNVINRAVMN